MCPVIGLFILLSECGLGYIVQKYTFIHLQEMPFTLFSSFYLPFLNFLFVWEADYSITHVPCFAFQFAFSALASVSFDDLLS